MAKTPAQFGAQGGLARAKRLSKEERSQIARDAAAARWKAAGKDIRRTMHEGWLDIGGSKLWCAVLDDGTRVLSRAEFVRAMGRKGKVKGGAKFERKTENSNVPVFLAADNLSPFVSKDLIENSAPVYFLSRSGPNWGVRAEILPAVCEVYEDAQRAGVLRPNQIHIAEHCRILRRGLGVLGIIALIDEATGAQDLRAADALAEILQAFIAKEIRKWVRTFPVEFFRGLCRLRKVPFNEAYRFPSYFGHLINDIIYSRIAPGVLADLRIKNPVNPVTGRRKAKMFQWLTEDVGDPKLQAMFIKILTLMDVSDDWATFYRMLNRVLPPYSALPLLAIAEEELPAGAVKEVGSK